MSMHMQQLWMEIDAIVVTCPQRKKNMPNVEYHAPVLLENIVVERPIKPVGLWLEMVRQVSCMRD